MKYLNKFPRKKSNPVPIPDPTFREILTSKYNHLHKRALREMDESVLKKLVLFAKEKTVFPIYVGVKSSMFATVLSIIADPANSTISAKSRIERKFLNGFILISECPDEWFLVKYILEYKHRASEYRYYECDQVDGLFEFLNTIEFKRS